MAVIFDVGCCMNNPNDERCYHDVNVFEKGRWQLHQGMQSLQLLLMLLNCNQFDHPFFGHLLERNRKDSLVAIEMVEAEVGTRLTTLHESVHVRLTRAAELKNEPELRRLSELVAEHTQKIAVLKASWSPKESLIDQLEHLREQQRIYQQILSLRQQITVLKASIEENLCGLQDEVSAALRSISDCNFHLSALNGHAEDLIRFLRKK